jgi:hypothetical protein
MPGLAPVCGHVRCQTRAVDVLRGQQSAARSRTLHAQVPGDGDVVFTPVNRARTTRLAATRRRAFADHLDAMLEAARDGVHASAQNVPVGVTIPGDNVHLPASTPPAVHAAITVACTNCRGWCCRTGSTNAWITSDTIQRVLTAHPALDAAALRDRYLARLPTRAYADSCVYHSATGCALEASLRSDTCHTFLCDGANELVRLVYSREQMASAPEPTVPIAIRVAATEGSRVVRVSRVAAN